MAKDKTIKGTVDWYQFKLGYGFISDEAGNQYYAHHSQINMDGFRRLKKGQKVEFVPVEVEGRDKPAATQINIL